MPDPKRPIAELVRDLELDPDVPYSLVQRLQAAIKEQIRVWDDIEGDFKCINDAFDRCISDLRGDNQGGEE